MGKKEKREISRNRRMSDQSESVEVEEKRKKLREK